MIVNNNQNAKINSINKGEQNTVDKNIDLEKSMLNLVLGCKEHLFERAQREMPQNGKFSKFGTVIDIPKTNNQAVFTINYDYENPRSERVLTLGVRHKNSDRMILNLMFSGTKEEILQKLSSKDDIQEFVSVIQKLSKEVDEYHSAF